MTIVLMDGFDGYTSLADKPHWTLEPVNGNNPSISTSAPRTGTRGIRFSNDGNGNPAQIRTDLPSALTTIIVGMAFRSNGTGAQTLFDLYDGSTLHLRVAIDSNNKLIVQRAGSTTLGTGTTVLSVANVYHHLELKATIDDSSGVVILKLDGQTEINLSSQDTRNGGNASVDRVRWYGGNPIHDFDDIFILSTAGSSPTNDMIGDCKVECILPSGNGNSSQFVGSDADSTNNYLLVDEVGPNGDTDYVESSTVNNKDTYAYGDLTTTAGTVFGVKISTYAKKTDAGSRSIKAVARLSGTEVDDSADSVLAGSYAYAQNIREAKPGGGVWTISDVNSAEFGVKVTA